MIAYFWEIRETIGFVDSRPANMNDITLWQSHSNVTLDKWERDAIFAMDRGLRQGYANSVKFGNEREQSKVKKNG